MWNKFGKQKTLCAEYREALEDLRAEVREGEGAAALKRTLTPEAMEHAQICESCLEAGEIFWESRSLLTENGAEMDTLEASAELRPWFAARVMAKIAEREAESRSANAEWSGAVTLLASRLAWVSALVLVVAGTLMYVPQPQRQSSAMVSQAAGEAPQYLFDSAGSSNVDDALAGPVER